MLILNPYLPLSVKQKNLSLRRQDICSEYSTSDVFYSSVNKNKAKKIEPQFGSFKEKGSFYQALRKFDRTLTHYQNPPYNARLYGLSEGKEEEYAEQVTRAYAKDISPSDINDQLLERIKFIIDEAMYRVRCYGIDNFRVRKFAPAGVNYKILLDNDRAPLSEKEDEDAYKKNSASSWYRTTLEPEQFTDWFLDEWDKRMAPPLASFSRSIAPLKRNAKTTETTDEPSPDAPSSQPVFRPTWATKTVPIAETTDEPSPDAPSSQPVFRPTWATKTVPIAETTDEPSPDAPSGQPVFRPTWATKTVPLAETTARPLHDDSSDSEIKIPVRSRLKKRRRIESSPEVSESEKSNILESAPISLSQNPFYTNWDGVTPTNAHLSLPLYAPTPGVVNAPKEVSDIDAPQEVPLPAWDTELPEPDEELLQEIKTGFDLGLFEDKELAERLSPLHSGSKEELQRSLIKLSRDLKTGFVKNIRHYLTGSGPSSPA